MQVVIEIDDEIYNKIQSGEYFLSCGLCLSNAYDVIKKGTPLPKGHGRLIDADKTALLSDLFCYTRYTGIDEAPYEDATKALKLAPTIIEADRSENE